MTGLALRVEAMAEHLPQSNALFPEPGGTPAELGRVLDTLVARLGRDNVLAGTAAGRPPARARQPLVSA